MSRKESIEQQVETLLTPIAQQYGVWVYDVEFVKEAGEYFLRAYVEKDGGVTINDCVDVSHALSDQLDEHPDLIEEAYTLEVSSPGLGRRLTKDRHFENSIGKDVELKTYKPVDGCKEFAGVLKSFDQENLVIGLDNETEKTFSRKDVSVIKLALDF